MGVASLVLGIISLIIGFVPFCGIIALLPAIIGLILGIIDIVKKTKSGMKKGQSIAGLILSAIAIVVIIFWAIVASQVEVETNSNFTNEYLENKQAEEQQAKEQKQKEEQERKEEEQEEKDSVIKVDYEKLHQEYMDNPIAADAKYKGKILELTGKVDNIDREIAGNPYITFNIGGEYSLKDVRITFKKSEEEKVTKLKKGEEITIRGECRGTLLSTTVSLNDCEIVK